MKKKNMFHRTTIFLVFSVCWILVMAPLGAVVTPHTTCRDKRILVQPFNSYS